MTKECQNLNTIDSGFLLNKGNKYLLYKLDALMHDLKVILNALYKYFFIKF